MCVFLGCSICTSKTFLKARHIEVPEKEKAGLRRKQNKLTTQVIKMLNIYSTHLFCTRYLFKYLGTAAFNSQAPTSQTLQDAASGEKAAVSRALSTSGTGFPADTETLVLSLTQC